MRPIDADAALKALRKCQTYLYDARDPELKIELSSAEAAINNLPTIQPEKTQLPKESITSDLISRQAAIDALNKQIQQCRKALGSLSLSDVDKHAVEVKMASLRAYRKMLENLPTIQPEPKEGYWIRTDCGLDVECKCSKCGYKDFVQPRDEYWFKRNFCPNCGAKMKGVQNG